MTERVHADVVVIGGGPVGVAAAAAARAAAGGNGIVVLVDDAPDGPRPLPVRGVSARLREAAADGLDWAAARRSVARSGRTPADGPDGEAPGREALRGVRVVLGRAAFTGPGSVEVTTTGADAGGPLEIRTKKTILATGTRAALPDVTGLVDTRFFTPDTILDVEELPSSVAVLGAGPRGVALAQAVARFGVTVSLVEQADRVLPEFDPAASVVVEAALRADGVRLLLGSRVVKVAPTLDGGAWVGTEAGNDVAAELLVVATGREADLSGLDLPAGGVAVDGDGDVAVDDRLRTSNADVLAAGRVTGYPDEPAAGRLAGSNAFARLRPARRVPEPRVRAVDVEPPVAAVGVTEARAARNAAAGKASAYVHEYTGAAPAEAVVRIVADDEGRLLGASVVGPGAPDTAAVLALAIGAGTPAARLADLAVPGACLAAVATALSSRRRPARAEPVATERIAVTA